MEGVIRQGMEALLEPAAGFCAMDGDCRQPGGAPAFAEAATRRQASHHAATPINKILIFAPLSAEVPILRDEG